MMPPWSPSSLSQYETCPFKYYHEKVVKDVVVPETESSIWGTEVHKALELGVGQGVPLQDRFVQYQWAIDAVLKFPGERSTELKLASFENGIPCKFDHPIAYTRCIIDLALRNGNKAALVDWKSGKKKNHSRQLLQNALVYFANFPEVDIIYTAFVWLQEKSLTTDIVKRENLEEKWESFKQPLQEMEFSYERNIWPKKPSGLCRGWCPVKQCEHWTAKR